jgi:hypothetical protein
VDITYIVTDEGWLYLAGIKERPREKLLAEQWKITCV